MKISIEKSILILSCPCRNTKRDRYYARAHNIPHAILLQTRAVGMATQMGPYFFLASGVPRFGSSANATIPCPATAVTAAAATANIAALRPLLPFSSLPSKLAAATSWPSDLAAAFAAKRARRGCCATAAAPPTKEAIMLTDAISLSL